MAGRRTRTREKRGLDETRFCEAIARRLKPRRGVVRLGIGDDAAVIRAPRAAPPASSHSLVVSVDAIVEDVHFRRGWLSWSDLGYRAVVAALSDLAAMAATPEWALLSIGLPRDLPPPVALELVEGSGRAARAYGIDIAGGDTTRSRTLFLSVTVGGVAGSPLTRSGGSAGDVLVASGSLGAARAALLSWDGSWSRSRSRSRRDLATAVARVRRRFARPRARFREAFALHDRGVRALIDVSDGLLSEAAHLARASRLTAVIDLARVPIHRDARAIFVALELDPVLAAATSGEEYALLGAVPAAEARKAEDLPGVSRVGELTARRRGADVLVRARDGRLTKPETLGWRHF
jgi:thiamine-monophosphate kinase